jgi:hypothetical protein
MAIRVQGMSPVQAVNAYRAGTLPSQNPYGTIARQGITGAQGLGFFDPKGSPALREQIRQGAIRSARNRRGRGQFLSQLGGLDPASARAAYLQNEQGIGADTSNYINDANLQEATGNRDYFRQMFGQGLGFEQQQQLQRQQQQYEQSQRGGLGSQLGSLAGTAIGGFVGGPGGAALGNRLFGGGGGPSGYGPRSPRYGGYGGGP